MPPSLWRIQLLGSLCAQRGNQRITHFKTQKIGALLGYLALAEQPSHSREELIELFWPEDPIDSGRLSLRVSLHTLRVFLQAPEGREPLLIANRVSVQLNPNAFTTDKAEFEAYLKRALHCDREEDQKAALMQAIDLYRGELLLGCYESWIDANRKRLADTYLMALRRLIKLLAKSHDYDVAIEYARRAIEADPTREESHRTLMRLYIMNGRPSAALHQYKELEQVLQRESGAAPSAPTLQLIEQFASTDAAQTSLPIQTPVRAAPVLPLPVSSDPSAETDLLPGPIPAPTTPLLGREESIAAIRQMLETPETRLVTLTGLAGGGKTRLALAVAQHLQAAYRGAVWWVPLASLADPRLLFDTIGQALRLPRSPTAARQDQVIGALARQPALLVLDNFEHLVAEGARSIQTLLEHAPALVCLVTSRQRLNLTSEYEYLVRPLAIPPAECLPERLTEYAGIQLFIDRARTVQPAFRLTETNAKALAEICRRLEGIPLAIELAAAWAQTLTPAQILARLTPRFRLLVNRSQDAAPRHISLRAALDWSYDLLAPEMQRFFRALAVFRGGWTLEAAEAVCQESSALEYVTQLRERSLLATEETAAEMRFFLLESLREYAWERLTDQERIALEDRHADYYLQWAEQARKEMRGSGAELWLDRLEQDHANLRAALDWSLCRPEPEPGLRLAVALWRFWYIRGFTQEGYAWLDRALHANPDAPPALKASAFVSAGNIAYSQTDYSKARAAFEQALTLRRDMGEEPGIAGALASLGLIALDTGDLPAAQGRFEEALAVFRRVGNARGMAQMLANLACTATERGDYAGAHTLYDECLPLFRAAGDHLHTVTALNNRIHALLKVDNCLAVRPLLAESLALSSQMKYARGFAQCLAAFATLAIRQERWQRAGVLLGGAAAVRKRGQVHLPPAAQEELGTMCVVVHKALGETAFAAAWAQGSTMAWEQAQSYAEEGLEPDAF